MEFIQIILIVAAFLLGGTLYFVGKKQSTDVGSKKADELEQKAKMLVLEAEATKKEADVIAETTKKTRMLEAKEHFLKLKAEFEDDKNKRNSAIIQTEQKLKQEQLTLNQQKEGLLKKEQDFTKKEQDVAKLKDNLSAQTETMAAKREDLDKAIAQQVSKLEKIANLTAAEAREQIIDALKNEAQTKASSYIKDIIEEAKLTATKEAKKVVIETIQRTATENAIENCVSVFNIESDDIKGKIIGREGRNIRTLEAATGVEFIVDDTPEAIIISGFDPVRREIARLSLHRLVVDGRIHPARIEEVVAKTKKNIEDEIIEIGEKTVIDLGIHGLHPELVRMVGRMRFRSSYGQNLLHHSREVARMCGTMAAELGLNVKMAKRAGLLHDIGKVSAEELEIPHALLGMELAMKYKEHPEVCNAIGAHHDEIEMTSMLSPIIQACDGISGARPGARREVMESYIKRLKDLEALAKGFDGVTQCYAIQAGRELRIVVDSDNITDEQSSNLSFQISKKIEEDMQYPGQIKVTVIREMRAVSYAK